MVREQQQLRDETFQRGPAAAHAGRPQGRQQQGQRQQGQRGQAVSRANRASRAKARSRPRRPGGAAERQQERPRPAPAGVARSAAGAPAPHARHGHAGRAGARRRRRRHARGRRAARPGPGRPGGRFPRPRPRGPPARHAGHGPADAADEGQGDGTEQAGDKPGDGTPQGRNRAGGRNNDPLGRPTRSRDFSDGRVKVPGADESACSAPAGSWRSYGASSAIPCGRARSSTISTASCATEDTTQRRARNTARQTASKASGLMRQPP